MTIHPSAFLFLPIVLLATVGPARAETTLAELRAPVEVLRDVDGIPHIIAQNEHDLILMQGWVHGRDRLFQMDLLRRRASGTLAELLGSAALASDVELRTLGLRRAAERSRPLLSPETQAALEAYAKGVNAFAATHPLPPEYAVLELTSFEPWIPLDSLAVAKLIALGLSFDLDDIERTETLLTYQAVLGIEAGANLFFEDTHRTAPFDDAATIPDASRDVGTLSAAASDEDEARRPGGSARTEFLRPETLELGRRYLDKLRRLPQVRRAVRLGEEPAGSNEWAISGALTETGRPLIASDQHLALDTPSTFYQNHLKARPAGFDVIGSSFAGTPYVIVGQNKNIAWGATVNPMDVTDVFQEAVVADPMSPSGLSIFHQGSLEPIIPLPQVFRVNLIGDGLPDNVVPVPAGGDIPAAVLIVPRRNNGPIIALDLAAGTALSVQYSGFSGTREVEAFRRWNLARNLDDFVAGLQRFDVGSQNWAYADTRGNIAYFTSAEMPLREDLQAGFVGGLPPFFIRNGTGGNEWLPRPVRPPEQAIPFEILPFEEMPQIVNPPAGFFVNANNDPTGLSLDNNPLNQLRPGGGIFYLNPGYAIGNRAARITRRLDERIADGELLSAEDMMEIQADVVMLDAQVFTPIILRAFDKASAGGADPALAALAADPRVEEAVERLEDWDHSTPTGIPQGFDARRGDDDDDGDDEPGDRDEEEIENSIAATIYSVWRSQIIKNTIDAALDDKPLGRFSLPKPGSLLTMTALRNLFDSFETNQGIGASGLNFFNVPGIIDPVTRRDILVLQSLADALDLLAGDAFAAAFGGSTEQDDYRWGRLHRLVLAHPLGEPFSIPPAGGAFPPSFPDLPGLAVDGGFDVVDASRHPVRLEQDEDNSNRFMFAAGPARRHVGEVRGRRRGFRGDSSLPGGESGVLGNPFYANLLGRWLTNESHPLRQRAKDFIDDAVDVRLFAPPPGG